MTTGQPEQHQVLVQSAPFDVGEEHVRLRQVSHNIGAIVTFTGTVRDVNDGDSVSALHLEHYPGMTEKEIGKIIADAAERWEILAAKVIHRVGDLAPGDEIVFVGVASGHRGEAFSAAEYIMDFLKTRATFWKKEKTSDGERWLTTRQSDVDAAENWKNPERS